VAPYAGRIALIEQEPYRVIDQVACPGHSAQCMRRERCGKHGWIGRDLAGHVPTLGREYWKFSAGELVRLEKAQAGPKGVLDSRFDFHRF
jgi:hypothetical protein